MMSKRKKTIIFVAIIIVLNIALIIGVINSVFSAFRNAENVSFSQNIENVQTLTGASANKVELVIDQHTDEIQSVAGYINNYNGIGMTLDEINTFFSGYTTPTVNIYWQLVDSNMNDASASVRGFNAISLSGDVSEGFSYPVNAYQELAKIFCRANEKSVGKIQYTGEFSDASSSLEKSFAVTEFVRIRDNGEYVYKTLMLLTRSDYLNKLISENNNVDSLSYFDYSNIIIDNDGNYVISNSYFQGTNIIDYLQLYNEYYPGYVREAFVEKLHKEDYTDVVYYKNAKGQDCAYTVVPVQNSDWHIVSMVPLTSFHSTYEFSDYFLKFAVFFLALFLIDVLFILSINRSLRIRTKEAKEANESKSLFLSSMSHDIRTPMNAIIGITVIANKQLEEENPDRDSLRECMKSIELSGNHLLTLINDILDITKIESGKIVLHTSDFSIADTLGSVIDICRSQIGEKDLNFEAHIQNVTHEYVTGDSLRVNQIFINILTNAVKYTNAGGKITVKLTEETVESNPGTARYVYQVSDNGIGMSPEFVEHIFDRFTRAVDTRINTVQGTGLGMAIVKQLVDLMGGKIAVESELNVGSVFTVTLDLPVVKEKISEAVNKQVSVLFIDDDPVFLQTAQSLLENSGAAVSTANGGLSGVALANKKAAEGMPYDVIFVDWKMADMTGLSAITEMRRTLGADVKLIVMTAYNINEVERKARNAGANYFITKPLFKSKLITSINTAVSGEIAEEKTATKKYPDIRILAAEDNDTNWKVLSKILKFYDIKVERAVNGKFAVDMVQNAAEPYDLVFMDIQMPVMNGYEATKAIRSLDNRKKAEIPIYAMTADTFEGDIEKCRKAGMSGHLPKPINISEVLKVIDNINTGKSEDVNNE